MRDVKMEKLISQSVKRTIFILFKPFSLKKWLKLLFIAFLAGAITSGGGSNIGRTYDTKKSEAAIRKHDSSSPNFDITDDQLKNLDVNLNMDQAGASSLSETGKSTPWSNELFASGLTATAATAIIILVLLLILLFAWLGARFKFIWFNAIVNNVSYIKEPFRRYKKEGNSLFKFYLILLPVIIVFFALIAMSVYFPLKNMGAFEQGFQWSMKAFGVFIMPLAVFIGGIILLAILTVCIEHFVITIMAMDSCSFLEGWRKFASIATQNKKDFLLYLLVLLGLGIICGLITATATIILFLIVLLVGLVLFGLPYLIFVSLLKSMAIFIAFLVIVGSPFFVVMTLLFLSIELPIAVFFRNFSLHFISSLKCGYTPILLEEVESK